MAVAETGKQRASRVKLDHYRHADRLVRTKLVLSGVAAVLTVAWIGWGFADASRGKLRYSHGPVSRSHATWEADCEACHVPFRPIKSEAWVVKFAGWKTTSDQSCVKCHPGPAHHTNQTSEQTIHCAGCHREHLGRQVDLVQLEDSLCTQCHASVAEHTVGRTKFEDTDHFVNSHPEFRSLKEDPGRIRFTHERHMTPGLKSQPGDRVTKRLIDLPEQDRSRYRQPGQTDDALVELRCDSCHVPTGGASAATGPSAVHHGDGAYMQSVRFDEHCRACHPLNYEPGSPETTIRHGMSADAIRIELTNKYAAAYRDLPSETRVDAVRGWQPVRPFPKRRRSNERSKGVAPQASDLWVQQRVARAERHLRQVVCGECHFYDRQDSPRLTDVTPTRIPTVWLQHAKFDHSSHRHVECRECHAQAFPDAAEVSSSASDVMIAGHASCTRCHGPRTSNIKNSRGARYDCVECHTYHGRDPSAQLEVQVSQNQKMLRQELEQHVSNRLGATERKH